MPLIGLSFEKKKNTDWHGKIMFDTTLRIVGVGVRSARRIFR